MLNHWIAFVHGFSYSSKEFYDSVEKELQGRKIPGLDVSRVTFREGGGLSDERIYLRMIRERLAFDICAAPFGTAYFFSCRAVYSPAVIKFWHIIVVGMVIAAIHYILADPLKLGTIYAAIAVVGLLLAIVGVLRNVLAMGISDLDTALLKIPALGPIYERWFRKDTYYRDDTRLCYLYLIPYVVNELAEQLVATKGIKLIERYQNAPIFGELYKRVEAISGPFVD